MNRFRLILSLTIILGSGCLLWAWMRSASINQDLAEYPHLEDVTALFQKPGTEVADPASCLECHAKEMEEWKDSHHALANDPLAPEDFEILKQKGSPLLAERQMEWKMKGDVPFLDYPGAEPTPTVGKIGLTPLIQYLQLMTDGRIQALDVSWDPLAEEWFSVFEREGGPPRVPGEWGHWTGQGMNWDANCAYCHMTEYRKGYDVETDQYNRQWAHMGITCAQCHPKMDVHLSQVRNGNNDWKETYDPKTMMESCAACHSRRQEITPHRFTAGDAFEDHFILALADRPGLYHPDGQVIEENYVYGSFLMSKMGHAGVTCLDCHNPHSMQTILPVDNNALCMRCHGGGVQDAPIIRETAHSRHKMGSTGNSCVECHMPETPFMGRDFRRDHSFSHPDPTLTLEMGIPNACTQCHNDKSVEWAEEYTKEWYGDEMNADRRKKARLSTAVFAAETDVSREWQEALQAEKNRFWKASMISWFPYLNPTEENVRLLQTFLDDPDPMVRTAAIRSGVLNGVRHRQMDKLRNDPILAVRLSTHLVEGTPLPSNSAAATELQLYFDHNADSPLGAFQYANWLFGQGQTKKGLLLAERAVKFDQMNPEVYRQAAIMIHTAGVTAKAQTLLEEALEIQPDDAETLFNLGLLSVEIGDNEKALAYLYEATRKDPSMEKAWYNLIVLYWQRGDFQTVQSLLDEALNHLPQSSRLLDLHRSAPRPE